MTRRLKLFTLIALCLILPKQIWAQALLEDPSQDSYQSGVSLIRGWACQAGSIEIQIDDGPRMQAAYGTIREDTRSVCGDDNNGFGLTWNWNLSGDGVHGVRAFLDGVEFGQATFTVTTLGEEFLTGLQKSVTVANFPQPGQTVILEWQQSKQNFVIRGVSPGRCAPSGALPGALLTCRNWTTFAPPRPFNPNEEIFPSEAELRSALARLVSEGWRGLITDTLDGALQTVPRLAKETGFTMVIAGLFWSDEAQLARERAAALEHIESIDGFVLGIEGLQNDRYTRQRLTDEIARLKAETGLPVTTSETFIQYQNDPTLLAVGDWVFPNLQFWFDPAPRTPQQAVNVVHSQYQALQAAAPGQIVVVKEAWWPTAGEPAATESNQTEFFRQLAATQVKFVFGEAYDQFWKREALGQGPHWGVHTDTGAPKQIIQALQDLYTGPY